MDNELNKATGFALAANLFLFIIKIIAGILSNSIALISEAINSLTDIVSSVAILISVRISSKKPDNDHQFGHSAAQPLATFIVAVFAGVLGLDIIQESISRFFSPKVVEINYWIMSVLVFTIVLKLAMNFYQVKISKKHDSSAIKAQSIDSINDVLAAIAALLGIIFAKNGYIYFDSVAGIIVAFFILKSGWDIAKENIHYLMGKSAGTELISKIVEETEQTNKVNGVNDIRSYYVGNKFHIEIHIEVNKDLTTLESHNIGKIVQHKLESMPEINKVFVHIDPV